METKGISGTTHAHATFHIDGPPDAPGGASDGDAALLPAPSDLVFVGGDIGAELAKLTIEMSREQRERAKTIRAAEERAQTAAEQAQIRALREKADNAFVAGLVASGTSVVGGACTAAGGAAHFRFGNDGRSDILKGSGEGVQAAGKGVATGWQKAADLDGARATEEEQRARRHERAAKDAGDDVADAEKLLDKALSFFKEYQAARQDTQKAALFRA